MLEVIVVVYILYNIFFFFSDYCVYRPSNKGISGFKFFGFISSFKLRWLRFYWTVLVFIKYSSFVYSCRFIKSSLFVKSGFLLFFRLFCSFLSFIEKMGLNICIGFWVVRIFIENIDRVVRRVYLFIVCQIIKCFCGESFLIRKLLINLSEDSNRDSKEFIDSMGARYYFHLFFGCCCFLCCC